MLMELLRISSRKSRWSALVHYRPLVVSRGKTARDAQGEDGTCQTLTHNPSGLEELFPWL